MQVSWIDADEVRDFVAVLAEPPARSNATAPDLDTLPDAANRYGFDFLTEKLGAITWQPVDKSTEDSPAPDEAEVPAQPDVSQIRERLRAIRDRAQEAGLLSKETPAERAAHAPPPAPPAPAVAQPVALPPAPTPTEPAPPPSPEPSPPALETIPAPAPEPVPQAPQRVTFAPAEPAPAPAAISAPLTPSPESGAPVSAPAPPVSSSQPAVTVNAPSAPQESTIVERLDEFAQWSAKQTTSEEMFMLDDHGDLLWGSPTSDDLLVCAKLAMNASMRSHAATLAPPAASTPVQVRPGKELQLVACPTLHGNVTLVLVNAQQVPVASLREALAQAMDR